MHRIQDENAIVLHSRPYRESSLIVQFLTAGHGRICAVAKGARRGKRAHGLQPFHQGALNCAGKGALVSMHRFELIRGCWFTGNQLALASYVVELVVRLTREWEAAPRLFEGLAWALDRLAEGGDLQAAEICLRQFEKLLLEELGYGLDFSRNAETGEALNPQSRYDLAPETGFVPNVAGRGYGGEVLLAIAQGDFAAQETRRVAKRLFRTLLASHLGSAPLLSRQLYRRPAASDEPPPPAAVR